RHRLGIGADIHHPPAHVGIDGKPVIAHQYLIFTGLRHGRLYETEVVLGRLGCGPAGENDLAIDGQCCSSLVTNNYVCFVASVTPSMGLTKLNVSGGALPAGG